MKKEHYSRYWGSQENPTWDEKKNYFYISVQLENHRIPKECYNYISLSTEIFDNVYPKNENWYLRQSKKKKKSTQSLQWGFPLESCNERSMLEKEKQVASTTLIFLIF